MAAQAGLVAGRLLTPEQRNELDEAGYTVIPGVLPAAECDQWSRVIDDMWLAERSKPHDYREEAGVQFTDNLLRYSAVFERTVTEPVVVEAMRHVLGPDVIVSLINGRRSDPGHGLQPIHELDRRRGKPFLACNGIWCLDEFTTANGATRVLPGSHLNGEPYLSRMVDPLLTQQGEEQVTAPRGAVIIFNSHLLHAGGLNRTDRPRRSVQTQFTLSGRPTEYAWDELPPDIASALRPESLELLGLR